jgi:hypothetical protein
MPWGMKHCYNINIQSDINDGLMVYWRIRALGVENITGCYGETVQRKFIKRSYDNVNVLTWNITELCRFMFKLRRLQRSKDSMLSYYFVYLISPYYNIYFPYSLYDENIVLPIYVINFVSDLQKISGFLQALRFPPPIKLTVMIMI